MGGTARDLDAWLEPFLDVVGHKTRRGWAPLYLRGLLGPGERKSLQPMAARLGLPGHDQLQHSSPARPGTTARFGRRWRARRTGWWAGRRRPW
jgi:SRSO17 transposase